MINDLVSELNAARVDYTTDAAVITGHTTDWTGRFVGHADVLVRPRSTAEVQLALRAASVTNTQVTIQGGNTGLVGGSVPPPRHPHASRPLMLLTTTHLNWLDPVDTESRSLTAGAGATLAQVQQHAAAAGLLYGVDLAARDSATIGGTVATNAGGIRVCAYGMTRQQVMGVEAVLADGTVINRLTGLTKDNTGYDLAALLTGSEGTLAVITAVRLRLHAQPPDSIVALVGTDSLAEALQLAHSAIPPNTTLLAAEVVDAATLDLVANVADLPRPHLGDHPYALLLEAAELDLPEAAAAHAIAALDADDQRRLWTYRERASEAASTLGVVHKLDISVPLHNLDALAVGVRELTPSHAELLIFGHLADGNLHVEIAGVDPDDTAMDEAILELATRLDGAVSAEHGVGRAKANSLHLSRTPGDITAMRLIKDAFDPERLLNPGVLLPDPPAPGQPAAGW